MFDWLRGRGRRIHRKHQMQRKHLHCKPEDRPLEGGAKLKKKKQS